MRRRRAQVLIALAFLSGALLRPAGAHPRLLHLGRPAAAPATAAARASFRPRPFPHLLLRGHPPTESSIGRGNARWAPSLRRPTILSRLPQMLYERGPDPARSLRADQFPGEPDTIRVLAIRVDFRNNSAADQVTGTGRFDLRKADSAKVAIDPPPHNRRYFEEHLEALSRYYRVQTDGGLVIRYDVYPQEPDSAYHLNDTADYGPWLFSVVSDTVQARAERLVRNGFHAADSLDPGIPWKSYQSFILFHAGADFQGDVNQDTPYDIPSFNVGLPESLAVVVGRPDSTLINLVMVIPETVSQDGFIGALNGVVAHEFGHQLGFVDIYDNAAGLPVVGVWSLMDSGDGLFSTVGDPYDSTQVIAVRGLVPASIDPWHRVMFPFFHLNLYEPSDGDTLPLSATLVRNDLGYVPVHLAEYFLLENREESYEADSLWALRADSTTGVVLGPEPRQRGAPDTLAIRNYDYLLPGSGVLVWHIDEFAANAGLASPYGDPNVFSDRRGIRIEEADGIPDIGNASPEFEGGPYDPYFVGGYTEFDSTSVPNSDTNDQTPSGVSLSIVDKPGLTMRVRVGTTRALPGWPVAVSGGAVREGLTSADFDGDGRPETLLLAAGRTIYALTGDGRGFENEGEQVVFSIFPDSLREGPAVVGAWSGARVPGSTVLVHCAGEARWLDRLGLSGEWPRPDSAAILRATAGPLLHANRLVTGCSDGAVRGLRASGAGAKVEWTLRAAGVSDSVVALAAGSVDTLHGEPARVAAGTGGGSVYLAEFPPGGGAPQLLAGWPQNDGPGPIASLLFLRAPVRYGEAPRDLVLIATRRGRIDVKGIDGVSLPGWPQAIGDTLAGSPAVGDPSGDGVLKVAVTGRSGMIHLWDLAGASLLHWPHSAWEPDRLYRPPCRTGPRFWDIGNDGGVELVQMRGDGIVLALDAAARPRPGWPLATGGEGADGPLRLPAAGAPERWYFADLASDTVSALTGQALRGAVVVDSLPGCFRGPGGGPSRNGVYPAALVPVPRAADTFFDPSKLVFYPNPVREAGLKIRYVLGAPASMEARAIDVSGRIRLRETWDGLPGAAGETHVWAMNGLAPGPYVVQLRIRGERESRIVNHMIALIR